MKSLRDADIHVRDAIDISIILSLVLSSLLQPNQSQAVVDTAFGERMARSKGLQFHEYSDNGDRLSAVRAVVRRRLGAHADVTKYYADNRKHFPAEAWSGVKLIELAV
jgi:hypothetical protein